MRMIKFRGKDLDSDKVVYGHFWYSESFGTTVNGVVVDPESVVQFIGYDAEGNEIYEGDSLIDSDGFEHFAPLGTMFEGNFYWVGEKISNYKLKGREKNENLL